MSWSVSKIGEVCQVIPGFAFKSRDFCEDGIPVVKIANITDDYSVDISDCQYLPVDILNQKLNKFILRDGDIVLAMTGATAGKIGRVRTDRPLLLNQRVAKIVPVEANQDFIWFALSSQQYRERFFNIAGGAAQPNISGGQIEDVEIPLPPRSIQDRVASILLNYDELIANNRRRITLLEEAARQLYQEWFIRLRFPEHENTKIVDGVPEGWERKVLGEICVDVREAVHPEALEAGTPYIGLEHMPRRSISLGEWGQADSVVSTKLRFRIDDIVFGKIRPYFHKVGVAFVDGVASSDAIVIRPLASNLHALTLLTVSSDQFIAMTAQTMKEGSKMPRADWKHMRAYGVNVPPPSILTALNEIIEPLVQQLRVLNLQNHKLRDARDLLLPRLMSGEINV
jgi:type I restriction enzyme S subunit